MTSNYRQRRASIAALVLALAGLAGPTLAQVGMIPLPQPGIEVELREGHEALQAGRHAEALRKMEQILAMPAFAGAPQRLQYLTYLYASFAADGQDDALTAHEYLRAATQYPEATSFDWQFRARAAVWVNDWADAGFALTTTARRWPGTLEPTKGGTHVVFVAARELSRGPATRVQYFDLLNALFDSDYTAVYETEPSHLWRDLVSDALERGDRERADVVLARITSAPVLVSMRIDRRFDALVAARPQRFDVHEAAVREAKRLNDFARKSPDSMGVQIQYGYALYELGRFDEMRQLMDRLIERVERKPPDGGFSDVDENLNWAHNLKAIALEALGRDDESLAVLERWLRDGRNADDTVSQAINLGSKYNSLGRPEAALEAVDDLDWNRGMSPYGRMQCQSVRFKAFLQLGKTAEAEEVLRWLREHREDAPGTLQSALLRAGDADGAAALLISRLRDADERPEALAELQTYRGTPAAARDQEHRRRREALYARDDVRAVVAQFGRREQFPIYSMEY